MSERDELARELAAAYGDLEVRTPDLNAADGIIAAGYRKIFDGDCGLSNIKDPTEREAAEAWMRWANIVSGNDGNGIAAMQQMLTELGYRKQEP